MLELGKRIADIAKFGGLVWAVALVVLVACIPTVGMILVHPENVEGVLIGEKIIGIGWAVVWLVLVVLSLLIYRKRVKLTEE